MRQFEMGHKIAVAIERGAGAGAKRQHHLQASAVDEPEVPHIGVVEDAHGLAESLG